MDLDAWIAVGQLLATDEGDVFVVDLPATGEELAPPLLYLHGFPTCSFDLRHVVDRLRQHRRVVAFDQLGFGLSEKPDRRYGIRLHADTAESVLGALGIGELDLLSHDMGDTVGGELLARDLEGRLDVAIRRRVLTNGSIYIDLAQLTTGQQLLMGLPDAAIDALDPDTFAAGVAATFAPDATPPDDELAAIARLGERNGGLGLLPRTIRYLEDRYADEGRFTGAIERHPAPLGVVWGVEDPVAVVAMTDRLVAARPATPVTLLDGVGHYPMVEAPRPFAAAVLDHLDGP
jgi:pimeloyl-ACP methyl ester carboxylesterase